jgi:hypothetical protein
MVSGKRFGELRVIASVAEKTPTEALSDEPQPSNRGLSRFGRDGGGGPKVLRETEPADAGLLALRLARLADGDGGDGHDLRRDGDSLGRFQRNSELQRERATGRGDGHLRGDNFATGTYPLTIMGASGALQRTTTVTLAVQ